MFVMQVLLRHLERGRDRRLPLLLGIIINAKSIAAAELYSIGNDLIFKYVYICGI
jgi:hypothetical protein